MSWLRSPTFQQAMLVAIVPLFLAVVGVFIVQSQLEKRLIADAETRLQTELENFAALYDQRRIIAVRQAMEFRSIQPDQLDAVGSIYLLLDRSGAKLGGNIKGWPVGVEQASAGFANGPVTQIAIPNAEGLKQRYLVAGRVLAGGFPVLVGVNLGSVQETLAAMQIVFVVFGIVMLIAGTILAILGTTISKRRLRDVNRFLDTVGGDHGFDKRRPSTRTAHENEYSLLDTHINAMLDRIDHLFSAHKRLGDAVAHEMRTPLARIQTRLLDLNIDDENRVRLEDEIRGTIRLFDSLLSIAQMDAEAGNMAGLGSVDLSAVCAQIAELYGPVAEETGRSFDVEIAQGTTILGDANLMAQLVSNLVENGLKYTRPGDRILLQLERRDRRVILRISDNGPGIEPALREQMFTPFVRGKTTTTQPGHGLGLSLVRAIALRHGAILRLPEVEKGFALEIDCLHLTDGST